MLIAIYQNFASRHIFKHIQHEEIFVLRPPGGYASPPLQPAAARRMFATPPIEDPTPAKPIDRSQEQAHPIGAYYESILHQPQPIPEEKPEAPPSSSVNAPQPAAAPATPTPAKRGRKTQGRLNPADDKPKSASRSPLSPPSPSSSPDSGSNDVQARARASSSAAASPVQPSARSASQP